MTDKGEERRGRRGEERGGESPTPQVGVGCNEWLEDDSYMTAAVLSSQILLLLIMIIISMVMMMLLHYSRQL